MSHHWLLFHSYFFTICCFHTNLISMRIVRLWLQAAVRDHMCCVFYRSDTLPRSHFNTTQLHCTDLRCQLYDRCICHDLKRTLPVLTSQVTVKPRKDPQTRQEETPNQVWKFREVDNVRSMVNPWFYHTFLYPRIFTAPEFSTEQCTFIM